MITLPASVDLILMLKITLKLLGYVYVCVQPCVQHVTSLCSFAQVQNLCSCNPFSMGLNPAIQDLTISKHQIIIDHIYICMLGGWGQSAGSAMIQRPWSGEG